MRSLPDQGVALIARQRRFGEYLEAMMQINRYVGGDAWVIEELLESLQACAETARRCSAPERMRELHSVAMAIADEAADHVENQRDRARIGDLRAQIVAGRKA
jgi:uncharacterized membrane protein